MLVRAVFLILAASAIASATYVGYHGRGGESFDLDRSVRTGSGGAIIGGRVK